MNQKPETNQIRTSTASKAQRISVIILVAFAILLRLIPVLLMPFTYIYGDMIHYDHSAVMLIEHHVYTYWASVPNAQVTPGYPLFLAAAYKLALLTGPSHHREIHAALVLQALISGLSVYILYKVARTLLPHWWAFLSAFLWATYPSAVWASQLLLTETLFVFFLYLYVWSFLVALRRQTVWSWFLSGLLLGLTGLVRPTVFPLLAAPVALAVWRVWTDHKRDRPAGIGMPLVRRFLVHLQWSSFAGYVVGFVALLMPWWVRNYHVFHKLILTDTDAGNPLLFGTDPNYAHDPTLGSSSTNETTLALQRIHEEITHQPLATLKWYTLGKLHDLFATPWYQPFSKATPEWLIAWVHLHLVWVLVGAVGLLIALVIPGLRLLSALAILLIALQLPFIPINRYAFPVMPLFMIGVAVVGQVLSQALARRSISQPKQPQLE